MSVPAHPSVRPVRSLPAAALFAPGGKLRHAAGGERVYLRCLRTREQLQHLGGVDDRRARGGIRRQMLAVPGHQVIGTRGPRERREVVVFRVRSHRRWISGIREQVRLSGQYVHEAVGKGAREVPSELVAVQDRPDLVEKPRADDKVEPPVLPGCDEALTRSLGVMAAATGALGSTTTRPPKGFSPARAGEGGRAPGDRRPAPGARLPARPPRSRRSADGYEAGPVRRGRGCRRAFD